MNKRIAGCCLFAFISMLTVQAGAISLSFVPSSTSINILENLDVNIVLSAMADNDTISTFDIDIEFNPSVLSFNSISLGSGLGDVSTGDAEDLSLGNIGSGTVNIAELSWIWPDLSIGGSFFDDQFTSSSDSLILATLSFTGTAEGSSALLFSRVLLGDEYGIGFYTTLDTGFVTVNAPVPEPTTMLLFGVGIVGLVGSRFRKKK